MNDGDKLGHGIEGQVMIWPIRPGERPGMMNRHLYRATVTVIDQNDQTVAQVQSDTDSLFRIALQPGTYTLRPESPGIYPRAPQQIVTVIENRFTAVTIPSDSGIR